MAHRNTSKTVLNLALTKKTKTTNAANGVWIGTGAGSDAERVCTRGGESTGATYGIFRVALLHPRRAGS